MKKAKVGRPTLHEREKRKSNLRVRLLEVELEKLKALYGFSDEVSYSEMIRSIFFKKPISVRLMNMDFKSLVYEVNTIRQDLNRISKLKNFDEMKNKIIEVRELYDTLMKELELLKLRDIRLDDLTKDEI